LGTDVRYAQFSTFVPCCQLKNTRSHAAFKPAANRLLTLADAVVRGKCETISERDLRRCALFRLDLRSMPSEIRAAAYALVKLSIRPFGRSRILSIPERCCYNPGAQPLRIEPLSRQSR
jgi:hypothetical protein